MLRSDTLKTPIFLQVTGGKRKLTSPFAKNFDLNEWNEALKSASDAANERDAHLCLAAIYFGNNVSSLREYYHANLFNKISKRSLLVLAVGSANRNFLAVRDDFRKKIKKMSTDTEPYHLFELGKSSVENGPQSGISADDVITVIIDTLPHWFFEARGLSPEREAKSTDFFELERRIGMSLSVESGFRDLWNAALWEGSRLKRENGETVFGPPDPTSAFFWYACQMRSEAALVGPLALVYDAPEEGDDLGHLKAAIARPSKGGGRRYRTKKPTKRSLKRLADTLRVLENSYVSAFLDEPIEFSGSDFSARLLVQALWVLETLGSSLLVGLRSKYIRRYKDASDFSFRVAKTSCVRLLEDCLEVSFDVAKAIFAQLLLNPDDTSKCFNEGVWLHPLIELDDDEVMIVYPSVAAGSKLRFVERTLTELLGPDLTKSSSLGNKFESTVRESVAENLSKNDVISDFAILPHALKKVGEDGEEIDLLFRIGRTVVLGELKCLLAPTESMDRYNHLTKLEEAASQAARKADWLGKDLETIRTFLCFEGDLDKIQIIPLVVLNQRIGSGLELDGVIVTDISLLNLFAASGSYNSGAAFKKDQKSLTYTKFYNTQADAEDAIHEVFSNPPPLKLFLKAEEWVKIEFPTRDGMLLIEKPSVKDGSLVDQDMKTAAKLIS